MAAEIIVSRLTGEELQQALLCLPDWRYDVRRLALFREIKAKDFAEAFGLMARIAIVAERKDHHPEWANVYNQIDIWLTTHDAGGVSVRDIELAEEIDRAAACVPGPD